MTIVIDRAGKGSALTHGEVDANFDSVCGINEAQSGTTYTVVAADQNRTIELTNAAAKTVTLTDIATILGDIDTSDFKVVIINRGAELATVTCGGSDTFTDGSTTSIYLGEYDSVILHTGSDGATWNELVGKKYVHRGRVNAGASLTLTYSEHNQKTIRLDSASGSVVTLPDSNSGGGIYHFVVSTTVTSFNHIIQVANGTDVMVGIISGLSDDSDNMKGWGTAAGSDTITMNGSTKGGIKGDWITVKDMGSNNWYVSGCIRQSGTEVTPFSAAVT